MAADHRPSGIGPAPDARLFTHAVAGARVVLDAGFGDGRLRPQLAGSCRWIGADIDAGRVAAGAALGWMVLRADITSTIPLLSESLDGVVLSCVLNTVADRGRRDAATHEVARVLRPGGVVWVRDFVRAPDSDRRVGNKVSATHWAAMRRRYAVGAELATWLTGLPPRRLSRGAFPAFDIGPDEDAALFRAHRYTPERFRSAVLAGGISVPFVACHPTPGELCAEWAAVGDIIAVRAQTARTRGGEVLPVDDVLIRKRGGSA
jgi:SAM-dependent methyltransferase